MSNISYCLLRVVVFCIFVFGVGVQLIASTVDSVFVAPYFQSNMVLQQHKPIVVFGTAPSNAKIVASFDGQSLSSTSDKAGNWRVTFDAKQASFTPKRLVVNGTAFNNILIGEVWLCAGQSNMAWTLSKTKEQYIDPNQELSDKIRLLTFTSIRGVAKDGYTAKELERCNVDSFFSYRWQRAQNPALGMFSSVAWNFAKRLQKELDVPVGVICVAIGGSGINNWIPEKVLKAYDGTASLFEKDWATNEDVFVAHRRRFKDAFKSVYSEGKPFISGESPYRFVCEPSFVFEAAFSKLSNVKFRGVLWYQGESDAYNAKVVKEYDPLFRMMVQSWRAHFNNGIFPFINIQLPSFASPFWADMRGVQDCVSQELENSYLVPIIDQGERTNIHYFIKKPVGERSASVALSSVYGRNDLKFPRLAGYTLCDGYVELRFKDVANGLQSVGVDVPYFQIKGADGKFIDAKAKLFKDRVLVYFDQKPTAVRYCWLPYVESELVIKTEQGLPLAPFQVEILSSPLFTDIKDYTPGALVERLIYRGSDDQSYKLPRFFDDNRLQAHTRAPISLYREDSTLFYDIANRFRSQGINLFTRYIKGTDEGAWWLSSVGVSVPEVTKSNNIAAKIIDNTHQNSQRIIAYYRHTEDLYFAQKYPHWVSKDAKGDDLALGHLPNRKKLCFNSPYLDTLLVRLKELAQMGVDGIYFDEVHQVKTGCWCEFCREKFTRETGLNMPLSEDVDDPTYRALLDYKNVIIERFVRRAREEIHKINPNIVMVVGSNSYPSMLENHTTSELYRVVDCQKTEFVLPYKFCRNKGVLYPISRHLLPTIEPAVKMAHGWMLARDGTDGRPAHIWIPGIVDSKSALKAVSATIGHGAIANLDQKESSIADQTHNKAIKLGTKLSQAMAGTTPLRHIAIHYPESARAKYSTSQALDSVIWRHYGAFATIFNEKIPVTVITDSRLEDGLTHGYNLLILPDRSSITPTMALRIKEFKALGGKVVELSGSWTEESARMKRSDELKRLIAQTPAPIKVVGGEPTMQVGFFDKQHSNELVVNCIGDFIGIEGFISTHLPSRKNKVVINKDAQILVCARQREIKSVYDALTDTKLSFSLSDGYYKIDVPSFEYIASIVIKYN